MPLEPRSFIYTAVPVTGSISRLAVIVVTEGEPANSMTHFQEQQRCATAAPRYEEEKAIMHTSLFFPLDACQRVGVSLSEYGQFVR